MKMIGRYARAGAASLLLVAAALALTPASPASAVACTSPVRYAATSNTIYLVTATTFTPTSIHAACPSAPLTEVDPVTHTWELRADLVLQNGATLSLKGTAAGGDVDTLRMRSLNTNLPTDVSSLTAQWGTITANRVHVLSWDDATAATDTNPYLPAGSPTTNRARAFVRALSYLDTDGTPRTSRLDIANSEFDHLGYYAAESYGVAYKTRGCDHTSAGLATCAKVQVSGSQSNSHFHDNFMGTYTWGAKNIAFTGNEYDHNYMYGLDPHDVSTYLTITNNRFDNNADHGVICSQKCDHLTIENNESDHNGLVPFTGPIPDPEGAAGQVHGIMLHRGVTNTTVKNNNVHDQPNGAGIAIFDTAGAVVSGNTLTGNKYGIRLSVGAANNTFSSNTITDSGQYAVYMYKGSDLPENTTANGHPTGNTFTATTINGTSSNTLKLTEGDRNTFTNTVFGAIGGDSAFNLSAGNTVSGSSLPSGQKLGVTGSASEPGSITVKNPKAATSISVDAYSSTLFASSTSQLFAIAGKSVTTTITPTGSAAQLRSVLTGTATVAVIPQRVTAVIKAGSATATAVGADVGTTKITIKITEVASGASVAVSAGNLTAGRTYKVTRNATTLISVTADAGGYVHFTALPGSASSNTYTVTPA